MDKKEVNLYESDIYKRLHIGAPDDFSTPTSDDLFNTFIQEDDEFRKALHGSFDKVYESSPNTKSDSNIFESATIFQEYLGVDWDAAYDMAKAGIQGGFAEDARGSMSATKQLGVEVKNTFHNDMAGLAHAGYMMFRNDWFKDKSEEHRGKVDEIWEKQNFTFDKMVRGGVQPLMSSLRYMGVNAAVNVGAFALSSVAGMPLKGASIIMKAAPKVAWTVNLLASGLNEAGNHFAELSKIKDKNGNQLDTEGPLGTAAFFVSALVYGSIENLSMDLLPGVKYTKAAFGPDPIAKASYQGWKKVGSKFAFDSLIAIGGEGTEEFTSVFAGGATDYLLKNHQNEVKGTEFELPNMGELLTEGFSSFAEGALSSVIPTLLTAGLGKGAYSVRLRNDSRLNFKPADGSVSLDSRVIKVRKSALPKKEAAVEGSEAVHDAETAEKMEPVNVVVVGMQAIPISQADEERAAIALDKKAKAVEVIVHDQTTIEDKDDSLIHRAAISTGGKLSGDTVVYETQEELDMAKKLLKPEIYATEDNNTLTMRDANGNLSTVKLALAREGVEAIDPDIAYAEDPQAPHSLARATSEQALEIWERDMIKERIGQIVGHTGGKISKVDLEANVDAVKLVAETLEIPTDTLLNENLSFNFSDSLPNGARGAIEATGLNEAGGKQFVIHIGKKADTTTMIHEVGHFLRSMGTKEQISAFSTHYSTNKKGAWGEDITKTDAGKFALDGVEYDTYKQALDVADINEERFADDFVSYLRTGNAPTAELKNLFQRMKALLNRFKDEFGGLLAPEVVKAFDDLFSNKTTSIEDHVYLDSAFGIQPADEEHILFQAMEVLTYSELKHDEVPKHTQKVFKLMKTFPSAPNVLFPLYAKPEEGPRQAFLLGKWFRAENQRPKIGAKPLAERPGIHALGLPVFSQGKVRAKGETRVWVEANMPAMVAETQAESDASGMESNGQLNGIKTRMIGPSEAYDYKTNNNASNAGVWPVAGSMQAVRIIPDSEIEQVLRENGLEHLVEGSLSGMDEQASLELTERMLGFSENPVIRFQSAPKEGTPQYEVLANQAHKLLKNSDGTLKVLYHGSDVAIDDFNTDKQGYMTGAESAGKAFFFTESSDVAQEYADLASEFSPVRKQQNEAEAMLAEIEKEEEALLAKWKSGEITEKQYDELFEELDFKTEEANNNINQAMNAMATGRPSDWDEFTSTTDPVVNRVVLTASNLMEVEGDVYISDTIDEALAGGYDGVYFKDIGDSPSMEITNNVAIFDRMNIHSIASEGNSDIRYQSARKMTISDLEKLGVKKMLPIFADRTKAGVVFDSFGSVTVDPDFLMGGPGYPLLDVNQLEGEMGVAWAVAKKGGVTRILNLALKSDGYAVILMMGSDTHKSNYTVVKNYINIFEAYVNDISKNGKRRILKKHQQIIYKEVKKAKLLKGIPPFWEKEAFHKWANEDASFDQRAELMKQLAKPTLQSYGLPPMGNYLNKMLETKYNVSSLNKDSAMMVIKFDTKKLQVMLGQEGTTKHPSYAYGLRGEVVGILDKPIGRDIIFDEYLSNLKREDKQWSEATDGMGVKRAMPLINITQQMRDLEETGAYTHIKGGIHAKAMLDVLADDWRQSGRTIGEGGISPKAFIDAMRNNAGAASLTPAILKDLNDSITAGTDRIFQLGDNEIYFGLKEETPWYRGDIEGVDEKETVITSVINNVAGVKNALPMIMAKAIEEGATLLDAFAVKSDKYVDGFLPMQYARYGFEKIGEIPWLEEAYTGDHTEAQYNDLKAFWKEQGWDESQGYPSLVVMKIKKEVANERAGYLQRLVSENRESVREGESYEKLSRKETDTSGSRSDGRQVWTGERDGSYDSGSQGTDGRRKRNNSPYDVLLELLSLQPIDRLNLDLDPGKFRKAVERFNNPSSEASEVQSDAAADTPNRLLYQLSEEAKANLLEERKKDVKAAIASNYWVSPDTIAEYAGEDWADEAIHFNQRMDDFPDILDEALGFDDVDSYIESIQAKLEQGQVWDEESDVFARRVYEHARVKNPKAKDTRFIETYTGSDRAMIALGKTLRGYTDIRDGKKSYRWGSFKGVSSFVKNLNSESTDAELKRARELITANPTTYRKALQVISQAKGRVAEADGLDTNDLAARDAYYDALGEQLQDKLDEPLLLGQMTERQTANYLRTTEDKIGRFDAREKLATHEGVLALEREANAELRELGAEKDLTIKKAQSDLETAQTAHAEASKALSEARRELGKTTTKYNHERARAWKLVEQLDKRTQATLGHNQIKADLAARTKMVAELAVKLNELLAKLKRAKRILSAIKRRDDAVELRDTILKVMDGIARVTTFNQNTIDASFQDSMNVINDAFKKKARSPEDEGKSFAIPEQLGKYLDSDTLQWLIVGRSTKKWTVEDISAVYVAATKMRKEAFVMLERKKIERMGKLEELVLDYHEQMYGESPEFSGDGSVMSQVLDDLMAKRAVYSENVFNSMVNTVGGAIVHSQRLARLVDGNKEGVMYDLIVRKVYENLSSELEKTFERLEKADEKMKNLGLSDFSLSRDLFTYTTESGDKVTLSKGKVIGLYVYSQNEISAQKLIANWGNRVPLTQLAEAIGKLSDKDKAWGDYMIDELGGDEAWKRQADVYYNIYNGQLGRRERYFTFVGAGVEDEGNMDVINGAMKQSQRYVDKGMTKVVNPRAKYPLELNVTHTFTRQVKRQEHFIYWAEWTRDLNYLMGPYGGVGRIISMNYGPKIYKQVQDYVSAVGSPQVILEDLERLGNKVLSSVALSKLSFSAITALKQVTSLSAAVRGDVDAPSFMSASMRLADPRHRKETMAFIFEMSPMMKNRTFDIEVARAMASEFDTDFGKLMQIVNEVGTKHIQYVDQTVACTLWLGAYDTYMKRNPGKLTDKGALKKDAAFRATQLVSETQSSTNITDLSQMQRHKSPWVRSIIMFTNDIFQHVNQVYFDLPFYWKNKQYRKAFGTFANLALAGGMMMLVQGSLFKQDDDDDDEFRRGLLREVLSQISQDVLPIVGGAVASAVEGWSGGGLIDLPSTVGSLVNALTSDTESMKKRVSSAVWNLVESGAGSVGIPTVGPKKAIKATREMNPLYLLNSTWGGLWEDWVE